MITKTSLKTTTAPPKLPLYIPMFNHVIRSFLRLGIPLGYVGLLTVKGRKTGKTRRNPVGLFGFKGKRYLFSTFGDVNWVRNVRAAGTATVRQKWHSEKVLPVELSPEETATVLKDAIAPRFQGLGGKVFGSHFPLKPDAPLAAFIDESKRHPVFELHSINAGTNKYQQPSRFLPVLNPLIKGLMRLGVPMGPMSLLSVKGRKSGRKRTTPIALLMMNGERYIVSVYGLSQWVQNLRVAKEATLRHRWTKEVVTVHELSSQEAAPILQHAFQISPGFLKKYFAASPSSNVEEFERDAVNHPVFAISNSGQSS